MGYSSDELHDLSPSMGVCVLSTTKMVPVDLKTAKNGSDFVPFFPFKLDSGELTGLWSIPRVLHFHSAGTLSGVPDVMRGLNMSEPL